jgi:orotate phosphoribosyltransferase
MQKSFLIDKLMEIGAVKFGQFTLKSGITSPIYIDLRLLVSFPSLLKLAAEEIWNVVKHLSFDLVCGVPYTALPMATAISLQHDTPMIMRRKEAKEHGTKKIIEGVYQPGQKCLILEDLITSGISIFETIQSLEAESIVVKDVAVLIDREQGGRQKLQSKGYQLHSVLRLSDLLTILEGNGKLERSVTSSVREFILQNQLS